MPALEITQGYVRSILEYDLETGVFTWRKRFPDKKGWNKRRAGTRAGTINAGGYWVINLLDVPRYAHRLAFIYMTGAAPRYVDHINGDKSDTAWANLRPATNGLNGANAKLRCSNRSGIKGVCWYPALGKWHAQINKDNQRIHLGYFASKEEAAAAYRTAAASYFGEFARPARRLEQLG